MVPESGPVPFGVGRVWNSGPGLPREGSAGRTRREIVNDDGRFPGPCVSETRRDMRATVPCIAAGQSPSDFRAPIAYSHGILARSFFRRLPSMRFRVRIVLSIALLAAIAAHDVYADKKTVCTITVNSPDERETFRRYLPADDYQFVELVERGRSDWLASACRTNVRCDVLLISGHFDGGDVFYTDRFDQNESLPTDELDRVACSDSCPGLFSQLKEVYLFGCNTLNAQPMRSASGEIPRSLVRAGHSPADADQLTRVLP